MLLAEIAAYLVAQGVAPAGSTADYVVSQGYVPPGPDRLITILETGGYPNVGFSTGTVDRPTFQVRVRGPAWGTNVNGYTSARAKIETIRSTLEGVLSKSIGNPAWTYVLIKSLHPPMDLGRDVNDRPNLVMNFQALRSRTS